MWASPTMGSPHTPHMGPMWANPLKTHIWATHEQPTWDPPGITHAQFYPSIPSWDPHGSQLGMLARKCGSWTHNLCGGMDNDTYDDLVDSSFDWMCPLCEVTNFGDSFFTSSSEASDQEDSNSNPTDSNKSKGSRPEAIRGFTTLNINFQSIMNKRGEWEAMVHDLNPDFICATETWLDSSIDSAEFLPEGYSVYRRDRPNDRHGGVFFAFKEDLPITRRPDLESKSETIWCQLNIKGERTILFGTVYKPKHDDITTVMDFAKSLDLINSCNKLSDIVIQGDFNQPNINWEDNSILSDVNASKETAEELLHTIYNNGIDQLVRKPTRGKRILDLVLTNNKSIVKEVEVIAGLSDHDAVKTVMKIGMKGTKKPPRKVYLRIKADVDGIKRDLKVFQEEFLATLADSTVQASWDKFENKIKEVMEKYIPFKMSSNRRNLPWFERKHRRLCRKKQRLYNKARRSGDETHWNEYKEFSKTVRRELNRAKRDFISSNLTASLQDDPKAFWSSVKKMRKQDSGVADLRVNNKIITEDKDKAEALSKQFASVFTDEDKTSIPTLGESRVPDIPQLIIYPDGVLELLKNLKDNKAPGPDGIPPWILKMTAEEISPILANIFQASIDKGYLPSQWREANICPIFKKGDKAEPANYRGVSLTSVTSKILEHTLLTQTVLLWKNRPTYNLPLQ